MSVAATPVATPVAFSVVPLLGGFCARLSPPARGWFKTYAATAAWLEYAPSEARDAVSATLIYEPHRVQNLRLQKTVLGLAARTSFHVRLVLLNNARERIYVSPATEVQTLERAPVNAP